MACHYPHFFGFAPKAQQKRRASSRCTCTSTITSAATPNCTARRSFVEVTGASPLVFEALQALGKHGVLVLASVTGGNRHRLLTHPAPGLGNYQMLFARLTQAQQGAIKVPCEVAPF